MADLTVSPLFNVPIDKPDISSFQPDIPRPQPKKHGTIDNVLGFLGDLVTSRLGMGTPYRDARRNEKLNSAFEGFEQDPDGAFKKLAAIDFTAAQKMRDQYIDNQRLAAQQEATAEARQARIDAAKRVQDEKSYGALANMTGTMASWDDTKRTRDWPLMRKQLILNGTRMGLDPAELEKQFPAEFDSLSLDAFADKYVPLGTQRSQRLTRERMETQEEQYDRTATERERRNARTEAQADARIGIAQQNANTSSRKASSAPTAKNIQSYVGEDGYKYTQRTDGSVVKSASKVMPTSRAKPVEGQIRTVNGKRYKITNGKPVLAD